MHGAGKLKVYYDGRCAFCQWAERVTLRFDADQRLQFRDCNEPEIAAETPFSRDQLSHRMYVLTPDGGWYAGYFGWVRIVESLPKWSWMAPLLRVWPLNWLGSRLYQLIANHRYRIPAFLLRWLGAPPPCPRSGCAMLRTGR